MTWAWTMRYWHILTLSKCKFLLVVKKADSKRTFKMMTIELSSFACCPHVIVTFSHISSSPCVKEQRAGWVTTSNSPHPIIKAGSTWNENRKQFFDGVHWVHQHHSVFLVSQFLLSLINHFCHLSHSWGTRRNYTGWVVKQTRIWPFWPKSIVTYYKKLNLLSIHLKTDIITTILAFYTMLYFSAKVIY